MLRATIRRQVRQGLAGLWVRGEAPQGGAVLAPNHHSWWDGYLLAELAWQADQSLRVMMTTRQLARFPFLQLIGARPPEQLRPLARDAHAGCWVVVFPEGAIQAAGPLVDLQPGAAWLATAAGVPLVPVALRVAVRAGPSPEAFVRFGRPCPAPELPVRLAEVLAALDTDLAAADPALPPAGYLRRVMGRTSRPDEVTPAVRWLARLSGFQAPEEAPHHPRGRHGKMRP
ncbi:Hypothetical protein Deide_2p01205 (plasmid) [Deinococcus deserti VCD115]|uniref:Phospholipid/glycerol acyltransferase domain-containing protein n=2 Tax=Deinococcus TaxID=1298 RepID=C1D2Z8_DEIDV|nr:Hypothetical protein Deide_2p01205 [Deinococcus deserti VCD115]